MPVCNSRLFAHDSKVRVEFTADIFVRRRSRLYTLYGCAFDDRSTARGVMRQPLVRCAKHICNRAIDGCLTRRVRLGHLRFVRRSREDEWVDCQAECMLN